MRWLALALIGCATSTTVPRAKSSSAQDGRPTVSVDGLSNAPWCTPSGRPEPLGELRIQPWYGETVPSDAAANSAQAAALVWRRLGVQVTILQPSPVPGHHLISDSPTDPLAPMRSTVSALSPHTPFDGLVHLVVMAHFAEPDSNAAQAGISLRGLTASPLLAEPPDGIRHRLAVQHDLTPTVFIDESAGPRAPGDLSLTPAHELGHALGLPHRPGDAVLMSDGALSLQCLPGLSVGEQNSVKQAILTK